MKYKKQKKMNAKRTILLLSILVLIAMGIYSCAYYVNHNFRQTYSDVNDVIHGDTINTPFFKIHFINGDVSILEKWDLSNNKDTIFGQGKLFDFNRRQIQEGNLSFGVDEIAIVETNQLEAIKSKDKGRIAALSILTGANVVGGIACLSNPKACFGSCPTFYVDGHESIHSANAEGFSSSISPCLEKHDLDALQHSTSSEEFYLTMKNEAFETHVVNKLSIDAVPKRKDKTIYHDKQGNYYQSENLYNLNSAIVEGKDVRSVLSQIDEHEYFSTTDSTDLSAKEEIIIEFDNLPDGDMGVVINYRQTLLTTFLLYSGISYMGNEVGDYFSKIETDNRIKKRLGSPFELLGNIRLFVWDDEDKDWKFIDDLHETGPIAKNLMLVPIQNSVPKNDKVKIKIELAKGSWRLDYLGLTSIDSIVKPFTALPSEIEVINGENYTVKDVYLDDEKYLLSFPGNEFRFKFDLPEASDNYEYELFLSSKGYYLEWIRQDWIKGKNLPKLKKILMNDAKTWRELAIEFKTMEHEMETVFWNSKYPAIQ